MDENTNSNPGTTEQKKNIGMAVVAYILFFVPLLTEAKNDPFVKFHVKQGLVLLLGWVASMVVGMIPILGWIIAPFLGIFLLILFVIGVINALSGKESKLPLIGGFADKFSF